MKGLGQQSQHLMLNHPVEPCTSCPIVRPISLMSCLSRLTGQILVWKTRIWQWNTIPSSSTVMMDVVPFNYIFSGSMVPSLLCLVQFLPTFMSPCSTRSSDQSVQPRWSMKSFLHLGLSSDYRQQRKLWDIKYSVGLFTDGFDVVQDRAFEPFRTGIAMP